MRGLIAIFFLVGCRSEATTSLSAALTGSSGLDASIDGDQDRRDAPGTAESHEAVPEVLAGEDPQPTTDSVLRRLTDGCDTIAVVKCTSKTSFQVAAYPFVATRFDLVTIELLKGTALSTTTSIGGVLPNRTVIRSSSIMLEPNTSYVVFVRSSGGPAMVQAFPMVTTDSFWLGGQATQ